MGYQDVFTILYLQFLQVSKTPKSIFIHCYWNVLIHIAYQHSVIWKRKLLANCHLHQSQIGTQKSEKSVHGKNKSRVRGRNYINKNRIELDKNKINNQPTKQTKTRQKTKQNKTKTEQNLQRVQMICSSKSVAIYCC